MTAKTTDVCPSCRGSGWVITERDSIEAALPCPECRHRHGLEQLLKGAEIPPRYFDRGFDVYSVHHKLQERALRRSIEYVESFPDVPRGLLLAGRCGVGKTHLAVAILKSLIQEKKISGRFVDETELLRRLQYSYGPDSPETERAVLLPLSEVDLLMWDDLGTGRPTEWVRETIRMVINHRYTYNKQTILTTNCPLRAPTRGQSDSGVAWRVEDTLSERIGQRLFSRIMEMCEVVEVEGPDARTEIHKARLDFEDKARTRRSAPSPEDLQCPKCKSKAVEQLDQSKPRRSAEGQYIEIACLCEECKEHFTARFFPKIPRLTYPKEL